MKSTRLRSNMSSRHPPQHNLPSTKCARRHTRKLPGTDRDETMQGVSEQKLARTSVIGDLGVTSRTADCLFMAPSFKGERPATHLRLLDNLSRNGENFQSVPPVTYLAPITKVGAGVSPHQSIRALPLVLALQRSSIVPLAGIRATPNSASKPHELWCVECASALCLSNNYCSGLSLPAVTAGSVLRCSMSAYLVVTHRPLFR